MAIGIHGSAFNYQSYDNANNRQSNSAPAGEAQQKTVGKKNSAQKVKQHEQSSKNMGSLVSQFSNRRLFDKSDSTLSESFERVLEEDTAPKANQLLKAINDKGLPLEDLLLYARSLFADDSDLVLVLRELLRRRQLKETAKKDLATLLQQAEAQANPRDLRAGINCALKARLFGQQALELKPSLLRASYRLFLENERNGIDDYEQWISTYGYKNRDLVLSFINDALMADVNSQQPSSNMLTGELMGKLLKLRQLRSADTIFMRDLLSKPIVSGLEKEDQDWLLLLLALLKQPENINIHLNKLLGDDFLLRYHCERGEILQHIYKSYKSLPHELFSCPKSFLDSQEELTALASLSYHRETIEQRLT